LEFGVFIPVTEHETPPITRALGPESLALVTAKHRHA
jgi:hypothetical protein